MSRYYDIKLTGANGGGAIREYTSFPGGRNDPGALNIEIDAFVVPFATPRQNAWVRVWGVALQDIAQATDLNPDADGKPQVSIAVYGGMQAGLPLANPAQAGLLFQGDLYQAFGNWQGTEMTLDLIAAAPRPSNIVHNWKAGTTLASAIQTTLNTAFPNYQRVVDISPNLVLNHDEVGYYQTMPQFAQYVRTVSQDIMGKGYQGVEILLQQNRIIVYDGTTQKTPKPLAFTDFVGQPTWIGPQEIQVKCVMRADLSVGDYIQMPYGMSGNPGAVTTVPNTYAQFRNKSAFQGVFMIREIRHVGNFRQADGNGWVTVINANPQAAAAT